MKTSAKQQLAAVLQNDEYSSSSEDEETTMADDDYVLNEEESIPPESVLDGEQSKKHNIDSDEDDSDDTDSDENQYNPLAKTNAKKQKVSSFFPAGSSSEMNQQQDEESDEESEFSEDSDHDMTAVKDLIKKASSPSTLGQTVAHDDDDDDIQLSDLISSTQHGTDTRLNAEKTQKELKNIEELKKIDKQYKKGAGLFYALEDTEIQNEERRAAFDIVDEGMEKWHSIVETVENSRHVPLIYKHLRDKTEKEKILEKGIKGSGVFDDTSEIELIKSFEATKKQLSNMDKESLVARHKEILEKRIEMEKQAKKNKWLKNIKSKTYRKILKKQKEKQQELLEEEQMKNMDEEELKQKILKREREMITERLTMRHKNTSKWVRHAMKHQVHNTGLREAISEQLKVHSDLVKKQTKKENEDDSDAEDEMVEQLFQKDKQSNPFETMRQVVTEEEGEKTGLYGMKFMKKANEKRKQEQLDLINQMEKDVGDHIGISSAQEEEQPSGRMQFEKDNKKTNSRTVQEDMDSSDDENIETKFDKNTIVIPKTTVKVSSQTLNEKTGIEKKTASTTTQPHPSSGSENSVLNTTKIMSKSFGSVSEPSNDASDKQVTVTSISMKRKRTTKENPWLNKGGKTKSRDSDTIEDEISKKKKKMNKDVASKILISTDESKLGIETNDTLIQEDAHVESTTNVTKSSKKNREQLEFEKKVKQEAFAGDDLELQFAEDKEKAINEEIDMPDFSTTFKPGWGSWAGFGREEQVKKDLEKKQRQIARIQKKIRDEQIEQRTDNQINHVIIRETAKVPDKFLIPVSNQIEAAVVDSAFAHPLGLEWNTLKGHKTQIAPRVNLQSGHIVKALDYETMQIKSTKANTQDPLLDVKKAAKLESAKEQRYQKIKERLKDDYETVKSKRQEDREKADKEKEESRKRYMARWEKDSDEE
ncbi:hypothetical protein C9374_014035 [Naegleria lovaniensis]|uniref:U3 small nucleolar RNA-associated protein 14 n=1 Tax=Naegleria lovaniensis TaxID=51637 RepID=A0AA88GYN6_NAELO|nr:uncharacterized protein C9374_014035 [Naegleria lovaniensis]KAG2389475.1 hypothetical protein C9374_014035 [Naegleria lovaniensis]